MRSWTCHKSRSLVQKKHYAGSQFKQILSDVPKQSGIRLKQNEFNTIKDYSIIAQRILRYPVQLERHWVILKVR